MRKIFIGIIAGAILTQSCNTQSEIPPQELLETVKMVTDSIAHYSRLWNANASKVLQKQPDYAALSQSRKSYSEFLERATDTLSKLTIKDKYGIALREATLKYIATNKFISDSYAVRLEKLEEETDSIDSKISMMVYESQKYNFDLSDDFMTLKNVEEVYKKNHEGKLKTATEGGVGK